MAARPGALAAFQTARTVDHEDDPEREREQGQHNGGQPLDRIPDTRKRRLGTHPEERSGEENRDEREHVEHVEREQQPCR